MKLGKWSGFAALTLATGVLLSGCAGAAQSPAASDTLNIATLTVPQSLDPINATGSNVPFFQAVYDTLIRRQANGDFTPMLATKWEYNADNTQLTLTLRDDVKFHDGTPFNAEAVKANIDRFRASTGADSKGLKNVSEVTVVDPTHVTIALSAPDPSLLFRLSDSAGLMANPAAFANPDSLKTTPDGTGPYDLDKSKTVIGTKWVYDRDAKYWGDKLPYQTLTLSVFDNENAIVNGLKTGQIDTALLQSADQRAAAKQDAQLKIQDSNVDVQSIILFDRAGAMVPALGDARVRQALNYAIDRDIMLKQIRQGLGVTTSQMFGTDTLGYDKSLDNYYTHDPKKAKELLAEAGYANGFDLTLPRMAAIVDDALAASLKADFAAVGVKLTWQDVDQATALKQIFTDKGFPGLVLSLGQPANDWLMISSQLQPGSFNIFGYTDPEATALITKIQHESVADSKADAQALNKHIVEQGWFIPFYRQTYALVTDGSVNVTQQSGMAVPSIYNYTPAK
ncbi:peptide/nickel transport system substrate-binding protein [Mycetocola sp. BIGb0189]|uniref:ABC transporter substrate-binding protein n=1 Tax=Mycetocola sp. BIGb0189 TaxID=2940604 RepID=UPI0021685B59|nr:ABC transporter substrate-binding protein [Mycetocola sp. BIGb0189]MCS4275216.1 peptide/nickel transport system substrate-binding protein [Mycetocola sp. BIGb0189]